MNTHIKTTAITLTPTIDDHIKKHVAKIEDIFDGDESVKCDIEIGRTTAHHNKGDIFRAEIHIVGHKQNIYVKAEKHDLVVALDEVFADALHSMTSRRKKIIGLARRGGARVKSMVKGMWPFGSADSEIK